MTIETKFDGEVLQFDSKIRRLTRYIDAMMKALKQTEVDEIRFLMETIVVMIVAFLDHFLTSVISTATYAREADVRMWLKAKGNNHEKERATACPVGELRQIMARRASLLNKNGRRLDSTFEFLFGVSVWPEDAKAAALVRDLARLRNLIVHGGGYPEQSHFDEMETPGLITEASKEFRFYRMNLATSAPLVLEGIKAVAALVTRLSAQFLADERWTWRGPLEQLPPTLTDDETE